MMLFDLEPKSIYYINYSTYKTQISVCSDRNTNMSNAIEVERG